MAEEKGPGVDVDIRAIGYLQCYGKTVSMSMCAYVSVHVVYLLPEVLNSTSPPSAIE